MAKFIEVHERGLPHIVNLNSIMDVTRETGRAYIWLVDRDYDFCADESYDQVRTMIANATGGIPMEGK